MAGIYIYICMHAESRAPQIVGTLSHAWTSTLAREGLITCLRASTGVRTKNARSLFVVKVRGARSHVRRGVGSSEGTMGGGWVLTPNCKRTDVHKIDEGG